MRVHHNTMRFYQMLMLLMLMGTFFQSASAADLNVLFILDGSGSMWGRIDGVEKIVLAKATMTELVQEIPANASMGLVCYGHRKKGDCEDIELMVPLANNSKSRLLKKIKSITPKGKTPIHKSIKLAVDQLKSLQNETLIVLVSDGEETCDGSPCQLVESLKKKGIRFRMHVVGFDVSESETRQLACIAEAGGGQYFSADNADGLKAAFDAVKEEIAATVDMEYGSLKVLGTGRDLWEVYDAGGQQKIGFTNTNQAINLPPGSYRVQLQRVQQAVTVLAGEETVIGSGQIRVSGIGQDLYAIYDVTGKTKINFTRTNNEIELLAGTYLLELNQVRQNITIKTGKETLIKAGRITVAGNNNDLFAIYDAAGRKKLSFTRVNNAIELLPGTYQVKINSRWFRNIILPPGGALKLK